MPLYMDVHENIPAGTSAADVAGAHELDLKIQKQHGVDYKAYWVSEAEGKIFCLVEAPNAEAAAIVHRDSHGLVADKLIEVVEGS